MHNLHNIFKLHYSLKSTAIYELAAIKQTDAMDKLNQSAINDVLNTDPTVRAEVLYKFLVQGISHRQIEKQKPELIKNHGWSSWKITQFFGFINSDKGRFSKLNFENLALQIRNIDLNDAAEYHLENDILKENNNEPNENEGTDILRELKTRVGQAKLRKKILKNYFNKCALCDIKITDLLVASHVKSWAKSSQTERIDPQNTILLCRLHDGLFDKGHISISDTFQIIFRDKSLLKAQGISTSLIFTKPTTDEPRIDFLGDHRMKHRLN